MSNPAIPSIAEIRASTQILSPPDAFATVVKVGQHIAVKFGRRISLLEAENVKYVSANSRVPVPRVYATMTEPETGCNFIVMEYQIKTALVDDLRSLPPPGYFGGLDRHPFPDGVFWTPEEKPEASGPFVTEEELNEGIIRRLAASEPASHITLLRTLISDTLKGHRAVFTHGDLQPKNILVSRVGDGDGRGEFRITIIDWEISGWYPDYWEFCDATVAGRFRPDWLELVQQIMPVCTAGYLMLQVIRGLLFY